MEWLEKELHQFQGDHEMFFEELGKTAIKKYPQNTGCCDYDTGGCPFLPQPFIRYKGT